VFAKKELLFDDIKYLLVVQPDRRRMTKKMRLGPFNFSAPQRIGSINLRQAILMLRP